MIRFANTFYLRRLLFILGVVLVILEDGHAVDCSRSYYLSFASRFLFDYYFPFSCNVSGIWLMVRVEVILANLLIIRVIHKLSPYLLLVVDFIFWGVIRGVAEFAVLGEENAPLFCRKLFPHDHLEHSNVLQDVTDVDFFLQLAIVIGLYPLNSGHLQAAALEFLGATHP